MQGALQSVEALPVVPQRDRQAEYDPRQRRVHSRLQQRHPEDRPHKDVGGIVHDVLAVHKEEQQQTECRDQQRLEGELRRIEEGNDDDRAEVVDHRQGKQKDLQRRRYPGTEEGEDPQGEGDIRRYRDRPAAHRHRVLRIEGRVDQRRDCHPPDRRDKGEHDFAPVREGPLQHLPLDLEPDHEEKEGHQAVVDPEQQRLGDGELADTHRNRQVHHLLVIAPQPRIGHQHGQDRRHHQQNTHRGFPFQKGDQCLSKHHTVPDKVMRTW